MSLIQDALDKTQNKISTPPEKNSVGVKTSPQKEALKSLGALDREVEQKIQSTPVHATVPKKAAKKSSVFLFALLGLLFIAGVVYWSQTRLETEAEPPLVVSIERHALPSKTPAELKAMVEKSAPVVLSPTDSKGLFFLSGIALGGAQPYAVINGQILRSGEMVEKKALLESIQKDHVILTYRGETIRLTLKR